MDTSPPTTTPGYTLDQLAVLLAVVETGSFSAAGRRLRRAQSAVSHAIANLERHLDARLLERGRRRATPTAAGQALLPRARAVLAEASALTATARRLAGGVEPVVSLAVDALFPAEALWPALRAFQRRYPEVQLLLRGEALGAVPALVLQGSCQVGITVLPPGEAALAHRPLRRIRMVAVAAARHPLAASRGPVDRESLRRHVQLVLTDRSEGTRGRDFGVLGGPTWRLSDLQSKLECLRAGLGWGSMPADAIEDDLRRGRLVRLRVPEVEVEVPLHVIHRVGHPPGPAAAWLLDQLGTAREKPRPA